jgi:hypothetical protein
VLIGAFSNEANVKNLKAKLAEQGIRPSASRLIRRKARKPGSGLDRLPAVRRLRKRWKNAADWRFRGYCGEAMTVFDYVVIGIVSLSLLFGLWRGVVGEVIALIAWIVGIVAAIEFGSTVGQSLFSGLTDPAIRTLAGCVVIFVGVLVTMALVRMAVRQHGQGPWAECVRPLVGNGVWFGARCAGHHGTGRVGRYDYRPETALVERSHFVAAFGNSRSGRQAMVAG